ncbi:hypothetical protein PC116_g8104 [Phytophthora cactorum]|uniref:Uncharacterized protein n=1 Tax=Phytophthora cactorum TaxID=29920 RepID=A0A8T1L4Q7_9STRA|nr:hypothetical protein Pcac1_g20003 [Phytophthora cactorum]KAG2921864.1 hypothetical protein PC114_g5489 [Phytophthora cactorum]KAG2955556.1 hypothetical protein PC117_g385 [Phytophthora cactorum]KAG2992419.1 hypothetical protein PC119_g18691 [Phytophthora cactorum]KAG3197607.1 hypothetical protein PC128_g6700 [Phytophthora cactorum]
MFVALKVALTDLFGMVFLAVALGDIDNLFSIPSMEGCFGCFV